MEEERQIMEKTPMITPLFEERNSLSSDEDRISSPSSEDFSNLRSSQKSRFRTSISKYIPYLAHLLVLCIYSTIIFGLNSRPQQRRFKTELTDPRVTLEEAEAHIEYEERVFDVLSVARPQKGRVPSPFEGRPTPENNEMWKNLTDLMLYGATKEEAAQLPTQTLQAYDDSTVYPVVISVYHHLHCLDRLRRQAWGDINPNGESEKMRLMHTDHCVENLRQALLCHGDTTPVPLFYTTYDKNGVPRNYDALWDIPHTCRNAEKLQEWAEEGHRVFTSGRLPSFIPVAGEGM